jgi:hypothetical protein
LKNLTEEIFPTKKSRCGNFAKLVFFDQPCGRVALGNETAIWVREFETGARWQILPSATRQHIFTRK